MKSQFVCDVESLRNQSQEKALQELKDYCAKKGTKRTVADLVAAACFTKSMLENKVDSIYPKEESCGEVVAMGTEDSLACGLLVSQDDPKRFEYEPTLIPKKKLDMTGEKAVVSVAAGGMHSVCLHRDGTVSTWGANDENALGRGEIEEDDLHLIEPMKDIKDVVQISAGDNHTTVLTICGEVHVCGLYKDIDSGKFRDMTSPQDTDIKGSHVYPCKVLGLPKNIRQIDAGKSWNAALVSDGSTLYTWGMGNSGQLARSKSMGATLIDSEYIDSKGKSYNYKKYDLAKPFMGKMIEVTGHKGEKFDTFEYNRETLRDKFLTPAPVEWAGGLNLKRRVLNFSCGDIHLLVVAWNIGSGQIQVFSAGNSGYGQLGHGNTKEIHELTPIKALEHENISKVAAGNVHSMAMSMNGRSLYSWGRIDQGALGLYDEDTTLKYTASDFIGEPQEVAFPKTLGKSCLVDIAAGETSSFAITDTGAVYSWGYNENSQTGHYNVPGEAGETDENGNRVTFLVSRPRLLDVIDSVNNSITKPVAKKCRVTQVSGGGQHSLMVIKRYK